MHNSKKLSLGAYTLTALVILLALLAWGQGQKWQLDDLSNYALFPLLGLIAFSVMWSHYMIAAAKKGLRVEDKVTKRYFESTSFIVLFAILLHPGLLIVQLWRDGYGAPPQSYLENYVASGLKGAVLLGMIGFTIFLAFELHRWFKDRKWWRFVQYASDVGMLLIFIHGLRLGG